MSPDAGDYAGSYMRTREQSMTMKQKAERAVGDVTGGIHKVFKQCVKFMTQGRISRAVQRLEAPAVCAGTTQVADQTSYQYAQASGVRQPMYNMAACR